MTTRPTTSKQWYIVHTYSGFEKKVSESLRQRAKAYGLEDQIGRIEIPTEEVVEMKGGQEGPDRHPLLPRLHPGRDRDRGRRRTARRSPTPPGTW